LPPRLIAPAPRPSKGEGSPFREIGEVLKIDTFFFAWAVVAPEISMLKTFQTLSLTAPQPAAKAVLIATRLGGR
jgi:hypothetical protein